jgi:hypothetical protein
MANEPTSGIYSGRMPGFPQFFDFTWFIEMNRNALTETAKLNSKMSTTLQALGKEWTEFVGARLHEDTQLLQTLRESPGLPNMQRAYVQFLEKAFSQYGEETQRLMRITQGAVEEAAHVAQERIEEAAHIAQERIEGTNGNARASEASSSMPPSSTKKVSPSHRDRA